MAEIITLTGEEREVIETDIQTLFAEFRKPLTADEIEWKIATNNEEKATVVPYIDNRAVLNRLDKVFGVDGWQNVFMACEKGFLCGLSIMVAGQWITKWDGAGVTDIEPVKGGISDAQKRAAHQWGLGRELYSYPTVHLIWKDGKGKFIPYNILPRLRKMVEMIIAGTFTENYVKLYVGDGK